MEVTINYLLELKTIMYVISWSYKKKQCFKKIKEKGRNWFWGQTAMVLDIYGLSQ